MSCGLRKEWNTCTQRTRMNYGYERTMMGSKHVNQEARQKSMCHVIPHLNFKLWPNP